MTPFQREHGTPYEKPDGTTRHRSVSSVLVHFDFSHLRDDRYRDASKNLAEAAYRAANTLPDGPDLVKALNHLKIAKDWAVCSLVAADKATRPAEGLTEATD